MSPALFDALLKGDIEALTKLKESGEDFTKRTADGKTPLLVAAQLGNITVLQFLIENKLLTQIEEITATNNNGSNALHIALSNNQVEFAKYLLGQKIFSEDSQKLYSEDSQKLHSLDSQKLFLEAFKGNERNNFGATPLIFAAAAGSLEIVQLLLSKTGVDINEADKKGNHALSAAAFKGRVEVVKHLLMRGAFLDMPLGSGKTILEELKARPSHDEAARTILEILEIALALILQASNVIVDDKKLFFDLFKPLDRAITTIDDKQAKIALMAFYSYNGTPDFSLAKEDLERAILDLVKNYPNARLYKDGNTALHIAITQNNPIFVEFLLKKSKVDLFLSNKNNETAFQQIKQHMSSNATVMVLANMQVITNIVHQFATDKLQLDTELGADLKKQYEEAIKVVKEMVEKMEPKERLHYCFSLGETLANANSTLYSPEHAYYFLSRIKKDECIRYTESDGLFKNARGILADLNLVVDTDTIVKSDVKSDVKSNVKADSPTVELKISEEETNRLRYKKMIEDIVYGNTKHEAVLGNFIAAYCKGEESGVTGMSNIKGKDVPSMLALITHLKEARAECKKKEQLCELYNQQQQLEKIKRKEEQDATSLEDLKRMNEEIRRLKAENQILEKDNEELELGAEKVRCKQ